MFILGVNSGSSAHRGSIPRVGVGRSGAGSVRDAGEEGIETDAQTILDVVEQRLGSCDPDRVATMSKADLERLGADVMAFYEDWHPPPTADGEFRAYSGGFLAGNIRAAEARQLLLMTLLYAHTVVIHDPLADWFDPVRYRFRSAEPIRYERMSITTRETESLRADGPQVADVDRARGIVGQRLAVLREFAPLIRDGIVIPIPHLRRWYGAEQGILAATRRDVRESEFARLVRNPIDEPAARSDLVRGLIITPKGGGAVRAADRDRVDLEDPAYYLNKTLAIAAAASSSYLPPTGTDWALYEYRLQRASEELARTKKIELAVVPALATAELPFIGALSPREIVKIRNDDEAFELWRAALRRAVRTVAAKPSDGTHFVEESRDALRDELVPVAHEVRAVVERSAVTRKALDDALLSFTTGSVAAIGTTLAIGAAVPSVVAMGISAASTWAIRTLFPNEPSGAAAVVAHLARASRK